MDKSADAKDEQASSGAQRAEYTARSDETLTEAQRNGFKPSVAKNALEKQPSPGDFRAGQSETVHGYSTGYHEAFAPTDFVLQLSRRTVAAGDTFKLPVTEKKYFKTPITQSMYEKNVKAVLDAADGARTDTAGTILSAPDGKAGGHSGGGNASRKGMEAAHDVLRDQVVDLLSRPDLSDNAIAVAAGATVIASRAPADVARTLNRASELKAKQAPDTWERDRNEAKNRLNLLYDRLDPDEKESIRELMEPLMEKLSSQDGSVKRHLQTDEPTSPRRSETGQLFQGGPYLADGGSSRGEDATSGIAADADITTQLMYVTQPFRASRQTAIPTLPQADEDSDLESETEPDDMGAWGGTTGRYFICDP